MFDWLEKELEETPNLENKIEILKEELFNELKRAEGWKTLTFKYEKALQEVCHYGSPSQNAYYKIAKEALGKRYKP